MKGWRYAAAFSLLVVGLGGAIYLTFLAIRGLEPAAPPAAPTAAATPRLALTDTTPPRIAPAPAPLPPPPPPPPAADSAPELRPGPNAIPEPPRPRPAPGPAPAPVPPDPRVATRDTAFRLVAAGRGAEAADVLERWLATRPTDAEVRLELARLRLQTGNPDDAWPEYRRLLDEGGGTAVREELAARLLAAGRHDDAAREYDLLLAAMPGRSDWRLAAARARLWGDRPRAALALLEPWKGDSGAADAAALRRQARAALDLTPDEARRWIGEEPDDAGAHLALARALARTGEARAALPHYERALATRPSVALYGELAGVASAAPDSVAVASALGRAVELAPADPALRRRYAEALAWSGDHAGAIRELDRLLAAGPSAELFLLRGDLARWRGDRRGARTAYRRALALDPALAPAALGLHRLVQDIRRDTPWPEDEGTAVLITGRGDSDGFDALTLRAQHGQPMDFDRRTVLAVGAEYRRVAGTAGTPLEGWGVDLGLGRRLGGVRVAGRLGGLGFADRRGVTVWQLGADGAAGGIGWRAVVARGPAYEVLRAPGAVGPGGAGVPGLLLGTSGTVTVTRVFGAGLELWSRAEYLDLADANGRAVLEAALRLPLAWSVSAVYGGGLLGYDTGMPGYWSPGVFTLHSLGLEYRRRWPGGLLLSAQALPGVSWSREAGVGRSAFQWQLGGEAAYRAVRWDLGAQAGWGRDRGGTYASWFWAARLRVRW